MEPFKERFNAPLVRAMAAHLQRVMPGFDGPRFCHIALQGLDALELKARSRQITRALVATLPASFSPCLTFLCRI
ncbi:hypothetical protein Mmc1_2509 [Magnetococcus marinus MC-1]|uniref:Uncharacterized protein n=1 Tax=Magnetococcus marinus (strain ATCC BAA-1437 / JCM 17883 / MC-1) TaxID=156889 RepID=A0LAL6_MAGMM|nr:hypothetical protein [Magnetococcus marinus]ABK45009.1 hypothetical protein Mmc1_2509 [Magnetococcus marinus MC-1]